MTRKNFSLFLALRYLQPKRTFVSVITLISVVGVTLGVTILLVVISVMTGFELEIKDKILGFEPHVLVASESLIENWPELAASILEIPGVQDCTPFIQGQVILEYANRRRAPKIRAIEPSEGPHFRRMKELVAHGVGEFNLEGDTTVIGGALAKSLGVELGDFVTVYSPRNMEEILDAIDEVERAENAGGNTGAVIGNLKSMVLPLELEVTGIFESGKWDFDDEFLFVPLHIGQELYSLGPAVHGLAVQTADPYRAHEIKAAVLKDADPSLIVYTWMELNRQIFGAVDMERRIMFLLLFAIIVVAAFCIANTMITVTVQKRREIGLMKALGAQIAQIVWIFLGQGMIVGAAGTLGGIATGLLIVHFRNPILNWLSDSFGLTLFPADVYMLGDLPAKVIPADVVVISVGAFLICALAALLPAYIAARLDPAKALRTDQ